MLSKNAIKALLGDMMSSLNCNKVLENIENYVVARNVQDVTSALTLHIRQISLILDLGARKYGGSVLDNKFVLSKQDVKALSKALSSLQSDFSYYLSENNRVEFPDKIFPLSIQFAKSIVSDVIKKFY